MSVVRQCALSLFLAAVLLQAAPLCTAAPALVLPDSVERVERVERVRSPAAPFPDQPAEGLSGDVIPLGIGEGGHADAWDSAIHTASRAGLQEIMSETGSGGFEEGPAFREDEAFLSPTLLILGAGLLLLGVLWRRLTAKRRPPRQRHTA